jgi:5-methyltetrahydrofolate--homocysteine methyltransferase
LNRRTYSLDEEETMDFKELSQFVIDGNAPSAEAWTKKALAQKTPPADIINKGLMPGMAVVGARFKAGEYYLPEVIVSARAMKASVALVRPLLAAKDMPNSGKVVIGTVQGDLHDIGKNLVGMMLEGAGFQVTDLGVDVPPEKFAQAVKDSGANVVGLSALLTTTMPMMKGTIDALQKAGVRKKVKVMVGGAPVTRDYAKQIGADGFAPDAASAVDEAKLLMDIGR